MPTSPSPELDLSAATLRPAWLTVDLGALRQNFGLLTSRARGRARLAVVKADAYGHGAVEVARTLAAAGVEWLGVALVEEGIELRRAGVTTPCLVLGTAQPSQLPLFARFQLTPVVSSLAQLGLWRAWAAESQGAMAIHLKVDTGMARLGLAWEEAASALAEIRATAGLHLGGLMSHLADADDLASPRTAEQERRFAELLDLLTNEERSAIAVHLANSAAVLHRPLGDCTLVRFGLALYGVDPAGGESGLAPVLSARAQIVHLRAVDAGVRTGYGGRWQAERPSRVAVVPVGYADGYPWRLGTRARALVGGVSVPVIGAVSMDMLQLDVTESGAALGDEVVLLGRQGGESISASELAEGAGTIAYEILCQLSLRLPRRYVDGGAEVGVRSRLLGGTQ